MQDSASQQQEDIQLQVQIHAAIEIAEKEFETTGVLYDARDALEQLRNKYLN
jgi:hypothetical protein